MDNIASSLGERKTLLELGNEPDCRQLACRAIQGKKRVDLLRIFVPVQRFSNLCCFDKAVMFHRVLLVSRKALSEKSFWSLALRDAPLFYNLALVDAWRIPPEAPVLLDSGAFGMMNFVFKQAEQDLYLELWTQEQGTGRGSGACMSYSVVTACKYTHTLW